jgi:23S rRNA C2498 (ribose-2'-O)-methylase RlmM
MLGGVVRTLTLGPRLIQSLLLLPELLRRLDEIERHTEAVVGNTGSMERSTATLVIEVAETNRSIRLLAEATQPLGRLVGRLPGGRRGETLP